ncbi:glycophorin-C-like [Arapaima gigas]
MSEYTAHSSGNPKFETGAEGFLHVLNTTFTCPAHPSCPPQSLPPQQTKDIAMNAHFTTSSQMTEHTTHIGTSPQFTTSSHYKHLIPETGPTDAPQDDLHPALHLDDGSYQAILVGVIIVIILVLLVLAAVLLRYMYRHKGSYHTHEAKGTAHAETADAALRGDPALQEAMDDSKKEYFI